MTFPPSAIMRTVLIVMPFFFNGANAFVNVRSGRQLLHPRTEASQYAVKPHTSDNDENDDVHRQSTVMTASWHELTKRVTKVSVAVFVSCILTINPAFAVGGGGGGGDGGASIGSNAKITTGGASTLQSGRTIAITRGMNLDNSNFSKQNLKGVAFQQSIVRDSDFRGSNLVGASFFDATLDGSNFEGADMTLANVEMAQFNRANLKNAILKEMYVSGSTLFEGVKDIEGSDWTDTELRKDQKKYLCNHPTAKGTNPVTGVETRESLMCLD